MEQNNFIFFLVEKISTPPITATPTFFLSVPKIFVFYNLDQFYFFYLYFFIFLFSSLCLKIFSFLEYLYYGVFFCFLERFYEKTCIFYAKKNQKLKNQKKKCYKLFKLSEQKEYCIYFFVLPKTFFFQCRDTVLFLTRGIYIFVV